MVEGTNPTTLAALSAQASPAADARRVSDIELVLLPSTVVGGRIAPNRLNRPVLSSGFSGIAYTSLLKTTTSWKTPLTSMMRSTSWFKVSPLVPSPCEPLTRSRAACPSSFVIRFFATSRAKSPSSRERAEESTDGEGSWMVKGTRAWRAVTYLRSSAGLGS